MSALEIVYRPNPAYQDHSLASPRFFATFDLDRYGADAKVTALPIYVSGYRTIADRREEVYATSVAGLPLLSTLPGLPSLIDVYLKALIRFSCLPSYLFLFKDSGWPIYRLAEQLFTRSRDGVSFTAPSVAELHKWLFAYVRQSGLVGSQEAAHMLYLSPADLQLYRLSLS